MEEPSIPSRLLLKIVRNTAAILCAAQLAFGRHSLAGPVAASDEFNSEPSHENSSRSTRLSGGAHCTLS